MEQSVNLLKLIMICSIAGIVIRIYELSQNTAHLFSIHNLDICILVGLIMFCGKELYKKSMRVKK
ncbi:hypothetical protein ACUXCC_004733 [Cytobacillus horneckiae]|uniref:Uncharacterized protein n=1 Tax=Cytobacillus horneckiae TaxID=549687 RepID=A0A2N0ZEZ8_9BACI|nr:hypothetical protein CWS20_15890 [Cytobacillus horneckiae]